MNQYGLKIFLLCLIAVLVSSSEETTKKPLRIGTARKVNSAQLIDITKAPYTVQLRDSAGKLFCIGTLITVQHVVTTAHCFPDSKYDGITVVAGATTTSEPGISRSVVKLSIHPGYSTSGQFMANDVAVLKLNESLPTSSEIVVVPQLCAEPLKEKEFVQISGWPHFSNDEANSEHLHTIRLPIVSQETCETAVGTSASFMCIDNNSVDKCKTVSGAPGLYRRQLCGILSGGGVCHQENMPFVFVNIPAVRDFILEEIKA